MNKWRWRQYIAQSRWTRNRVKPKTHRRRDATVESRLRCERTRRQPSWASCKLCSHLRRRRDSTRQLRRVGGAYWASAEPMKRVLLCTDDPVHIWPRRSVRSVVRLRADDVRGDVWVRHWAHVVDGLHGRSERRTEEDRSQLSWNLSQDDHRLLMISTRAVLGRGNWVTPPALWTDHNFSVQIQCITVGLPTF